MGLYGLFYLIVASFAPQLLDRVPVLLALLALDLLAQGALDGVFLARFRFGRNQPVKRRVTGTVEGIGFDHVRWTAVRRIP